MLFRKIGVISHLAAIAHFPARCFLIVPDLDGVLVLCPALVGERVVKVPPLSSFPLYIPLFRSIFVTRAVVRTPAELIDRSIISPRMKLISRTTPTRMTA